jgi:hypothetical protein
MKVIRTKVDFFPRLSAGEQRLVKLLDNVRDLRPLMIERIAPLTRQMLLRHWSSHGAAFGRPWAAWAESTRRRRIAKGTAALGLLRDSDHLYDAIFRDRPADSRLRRIQGRLRFQLNTAVPYGIFHQRGTKRMPARQIFPSPMPVAFRAEIRAVVRDFIRSRSSAVA